MLEFAVLALAIPFLASSAAAHGGVTSYVIGETIYTGWQPFDSPSGQSSIERPYSSYNPIYSAVDSTISCNNNGQASGSQLSAIVAAGTNVSAQWAQWTHLKGPVMVYMAKCPSSCTAANSSTLDWFKIAETGLESGTVMRVYLYFSHNQRKTEVDFSPRDGVWGTENVMDTLSYEANIPAALAPGEYMIRHELLAIHEPNVPQFYPECAQLIVTGSGTATPPSSYTVKFPGGYDPNDPSIDIDIYSPENQVSTTYKCPGPPVWYGQSSLTL